jgi:hypothetical protein
MSGDNHDDDEVDEDEIVEKFILAFSNDDYDAEFDDALCLDRIESVTLPPVRPTQASYNKPDNWIERNRIGLDKIKGQLQCLIDSLSHGSSFKFQLQLRNNILMDGEEPIVWHEPVLGQYWDQLETEFDRRNQLLNRVTDICNIQFMNVEVKKERLAALVAIFRSGRATNSSMCLHFDNANLCEVGIISLSKLADVSLQLITLSIIHNRIDNMGSARRLSRSLMSHTCINTLSLPHCDLGSNPEILSVILQSDISFINLQNNNIDSLGAVKISEYLEVDSPIFSIHLSHNHLNDNDAILISQALKRNTNLRYLNLLVNNFTTIGAKALLTCVFDSSSLNSISESNHTLNQLIICSKRSNIQLHGCIDRLLQLDRAQKICLALQDKDSLLKYLATVPVELILEVLEFSRWVDDQPHTNI